MLEMEQTGDRLLRVRDDAMLRHEVCSINALCAVPLALLAGGTVLRFEQHSVDFVADRFH